MTSAKAGRDRVLNRQDQADQSGALAAAAAWAARNRRRRAPSARPQRVASDTPGLPLRTRLTVASLDPTFFATPEQVVASCAA